MSIKGPYLNDVYTGRRGRGYPNSDIVREVALTYYFRSGQNADKGERVKNPENLVDVI